MTCRCPVCDHVLIDLLVDSSTTILSCERCDRGFRAADARCEHCSCANPFARVDDITFVCMSCGVIQTDPAARMSA
jgi:hypothetical protein